MLFSIQGSTARKYQTEFGWHVSAEQMRLMLLKILRSCWSEKQFKSANIDLNWWTIFGQGILPLQTNEK